MAKYSKFILCIAMFFLYARAGFCNSRSVSLNGQWQIWFDSAAQWQKEKLILEPNDLNSIPLYPPSEGWDEILKKGESISVPSVWEEKYPEYDGVAWYWKELEIPAEYKGKVLRLKFQAVRHRAEVYVNRKLVGYNLEGFTPFEADITDAVKYGEKNLLAVRVTDPGGGDNWRDYNPIPFGDVNLPDSHNFGGIWQGVELLITNPLYIEDIYVQPQEDLKTILIQTTLRNKAADSSVELVFEVVPCGQNPDEEAVVENRQNLSCAANQQTIAESQITIPQPQLWSPENPFLYDLKVTVKSADKVIDAYTVQFGMRFFTEKNGNLYLNGRRIFVKCAISWGYYPKTIAYPTNQMAEKEIRTAKSFGFNVFGAHRSCATPALLEAADRLGIMIYQEPGGAPRDREPQPKNSAEVFERELFLQKFQRLIRQDRNHPSLVWWNCANEAAKDLPAEPPNLKPYIDRMMRMVHKEDPSRLVTYTSESGLVPMFRPYDKDYGQLCELHTVLNTPIVWRDRLYLEHLAFFPPRPNLAVYNGESRCFTALSDLPKVVSEYEPIIPKSDGAAVKDWLDALNRDFEQLGLKEDFGDSGNFCRLTGIVQGTGFARMAEAMRLNPDIDGFALNGWHCHHILGTSGMVDIFRDPKFSPEILADAMKPLRLAICPLPCVAYGNEEVAIKISLLNETSFSGTSKLTVRITDPDNKTIFSDKKKIGITKDNEKFVWPAAEYRRKFDGKSGYYHITAELKKQNKIIAQQQRDVFVQNIEELKLPKGNIYWSDEENLIPYYLDEKQTYWFRRERKFSHFYSKDIVYVFGRYNGERLPEFLNMVRNGQANIVWLEYDMKSAEKVLGILKEQGVLPANAEPLAYPKQAWLGSWEFCKKHPIFDGLPNPAIFNWEYGEVYAPWGIKNFPGQTIAGLCNAPPAMATTVGIINCGKGKIIFCSLNLAKLLGKNPVADRLFAQLVEFALPVVEMNKQTEQPVQRRFRSFDFLLKPLHLSESN
jgi:hypothetical protein